MTVELGRFLSGSGITPEAVRNFFLRIASPISQEDADMIQKLPYWERKRMTPQALSGVLFWHYNPDDPAHVGQILTNHGKSQRLGEVARSYLANLPLLEDKHPAFVSKVKKIGEVLEKGVYMPPLLIVAGRRPKSFSLVDGNFRALALTVQSIINPDRDWQIEAFVGRKPYPVEVLLTGSRILQPLSLRRAHL